MLLVVSSHGIPAGTASTAGFTWHCEFDGAVFTHTHAGYGMLGSGYGVQKPDPRVTCVEPYMPPCIPPMAPVHVDPVATTTLTLTCCAFATLSCRQAASFHPFILEEVFGGFWRGFGFRTWTFACWRGGTCDSELGSYPGQVMQCQGS